LTIPDPEAMRRLGRWLGEHLCPGDVLALTGDLGAGKTTLTQGIALGLGVPEHIYLTSATFTMIQEYPGRIPLFHVDLYRLEKGVDPWSLGLEEILYGSGLVVIEWADFLPQNYLKDHLELAITFMGETFRQVSIKSYGHRYEGVLGKLNKGSRTILNP